jgi:hypothetical protein
MNFNYTPQSGWIMDGKYRHFGHADKSDIGEDVGVKISLDFRNATNGIIINTIVDQTPVITTSAATF